MSDESDDWHRTVVLLSPECLVKLQQCTLLLRKVSQRKDMPTQGETVNWVLECFPADQMWSDIYGDGKKEKASSA